MNGCNKTGRFGVKTLTLGLLVLFSFSTATLVAQETLRSESKLKSETRSPAESSLSTQEPRKLLLDQGELISLSGEGKMTAESAAMHRPGAFTPNLSARATQFSAPGWDVGPHKYLVLEKKSKLKHSRSAEQSPAPIIENRPVSPYAYGWFGTKMNRHPHRSFGYQQAYTQWAFE